MRPPTICRVHSCTPGRRDAHSTAIAATQLGAGGRKRAGWKGQGESGREKERKKEKRGARNEGREKEKVTGG